MLRRWRDRWIVAAAGRPVASADGRVGDVRAVVGATIFQRGFLLESVYQAVLAYELGRRGLRVRQEVPIGVVYDALRLDVGFRADPIVNDLGEVELKSVERVAPVHEKQTLTYVKLANLRLGILISFGAPRIKDGTTRLANGLPE